MTSISFRALHSFVMVSVALLIGGQLVQAQQPSWGRSHHGSHFDVGPRAKPWRFDGIGHTKSPVTSSHPEVQEWFNQGHTLLHSFWYHEAERSFRWCLKLDPDCAMAYWGLARCSERDPMRERRFFKEALHRQDSLSQRERDYLALWQAKYEIKGDAEKRAEAFEEYLKRFDNLLIDYPQDLEARALYWHEVQALQRKAHEGETSPLRYAMDRVLQEILLNDPDHVGALHYRVHNWDGEEGHYALDTCLHLSKVAPNSGHLQHMPGHVLSSIGLWNEAAIAMDAATRVEKSYMRRRMILPEENWDYVHNLDYLAYIQEQLGLQTAARTSLEQLRKGPAWTKGTPLGDLTNWSAVRFLIKFERWNEILAEESNLFRWDQNGLADPAIQSYLRTHALIGLGRLDEAEREYQRFKNRVGLFIAPRAGKELAKKWLPEWTRGLDDDKEFPANRIEAMVASRAWELRGKLALAKGEIDDGIADLTRAAEAQAEHWHNDPPMDACFLYNTLGDALLELGRNQEAVEAFEMTLQKVFNDGFAYSGLVVAHHRLGRHEEAEVAMGRLTQVWKHAESNRWLDRAKATKVEPRLPSEERPKERDYKTAVLDVQGPSLWAPPKAPKLSAFNSQGELSTLENLRGKNVILIFYLGGECLHCMEQIQEANRRASEFDTHDTVIVAVSKDDAETLQGYEADGFEITLLSDLEFENARRFRSYDDFEEIELHSTILIDRDGQVHWSQHGGEPFMNFDYLKREVQHLNRIHRSPPEVVAVDPERN